MNPVAGLDARQFRRRWAEVDAFMRREAKALTPRERLEQLDALYLFLRSSEGADGPAPRTADERIQRRWDRLRRALGGAA